MNMPAWECVCGQQHTTDYKDVSHHPLPTTILLKKQATLEAEIASVLNKYNAEDSSNTPDFILARYLLSCLAAYNLAVQKRTQWFVGHPETVEFISRPLP